MENLPVDLQWNIMKFVRHPVSDVFHDVVLKYFERDVYLRRWDIKYDLDRDPYNSFVQARYQKKLKNINAYSLYDFFKQDKYALKFWDKCYLEDCDDVMR